MQINCSRSGDLYRAWWDAVALMAITLFLHFVIRNVRHWWCDTKRRCRCSKSSYADVLGIAPCKYSCSVTKTTTFTAVAINLSLNYPCKCLSLGTFLYFCVLLWMVVCKQGTRRWCSISNKIFIWLMGPFGTRNVFFCVETLAQNYILARNKGKGLSLDKDIFGGGVIYWRRGGVERFSAEFL